MILREECPTCRGRAHWINGKAEGVCPTCDGIGTVYIADAPAFGCSMTLGQFEPGDRVLLGTGERARVQWHQPKKTKKRKAEVTFVSVIDDFDDYESAPKMYPSALGVRESLDDVIVGRRLQDEHVGEKDADELDPMATRVRMAGDAGELFSTYQGDTNDEEEDGTEAQSKNA